MIGGPSSEAPWIRDIESRLLTVRRCSSHRADPFYDYCDKGWERGIIYLFANLWPRSDSAMCLAAPGRRGGRARDDSRSRRVRACKTSGPRVAGWDRPESALHDAEVVAEHANRRGVYSRMSWGRGCGAGKCHHSTSALAAMTDATAPAMKDPPCLFMARAHCPTRLGGA